MDGKTRWCTSISLRIMMIRRASVLVTRIFPIACFAVYDQHLAG